MIHALMLLAIQAAAAAPAPPAPPQVRKVQTIVIHRDPAGSEKSRSDEGSPPVKREIRIVSGPGDKRRTIVAECQGGERFDTQATGDKGGKKTTTSVTVCSTGGSQLDALETARASIAGNQDLPADVRDRVLAEMNLAIKDLKTGQ